MDGRRFDELVKTMLAPASRRRVVAGLLAAGFGGAVAPGLGGGVAAQERCGRGEVRRRNRGCRCSAERCADATGAGDNGEGGRFGCYCTTTVERDRRCANDSYCLDTEPCTTDADCRGVFGPEAFCQAPNATACFEERVCGLPCGTAFPSTATAARAASGGRQSGR